MSKNKRLKIAVIYHVWAHYREPIVRLMSQQEGPDPEYTIFSDVHTPEDSLKTIDPAKAALPIQDGGLRWRFLHNIWFLPSMPFLWQKGVLKLAWSKEYDVLIFLGSVYFISTWFAAIIARLRSKRVLMWSHGFTRRDSGLKGWLRRIFYRLAHGMLLYGDWAKKMMIEMGFDPNKLYVVFNSLDYDKQLKLRHTITQCDIAKVRRNLFMRPDLPILLFIGRLTPQKQLTMLLDAVELLARDIHAFPVNLLFVGDGPSRNILERAAQKAGLAEFVHFYGACHDEDVLAPLIASADLCVAPGEVGLTAMHALVYGTPVITHDDPTCQMPEYEAIKPGISGAFFRKGDTAHLAHVIRDFYSKTLDRDEVRQQCYEVIDKYYNPHFQMQVLNAAVSGEKSAV